jgi:hypothetical protein
MHFPVATNTYGHYHKPSERCDVRSRRDELGSRSIRHKLSGGFRPERSLIDLLRENGQSLRSAQQRLEQLRQQRPAHARECSACRSTVKRQGGGGGSGEVGAAPLCHTHALMAQKHLQERVTGLLGWSDAIAAITPRRSARARHAAAERNPADGWTPLHVVTELSAACEAEAEEARLAGLARFVRCLLRCWPEGAAQVRRCGRSLSLSLAVSLCLSLALSLSLSLSLCVCVCVWCGVVWCVSSL